MTHVTRIRMFGLVALLIALAAGCGGSTHYTMASVSSCLREHGAAHIEAAAVPVNQDPDVGVLLDGYLGTISGSFKGFGFTVFVADSRAYASDVEGAPGAQSAIAPCVTGFDSGP